MSDMDHPAEHLNELRKRAQAYITAPPDEAPSLSQEAVKKLISELDTYQVELEMQNEDLRRTQLELEASRRRISDLYDFAPVGYLTVDEKGLIIEANLTLTDMLGTDKTSLIGHSLSDFIAPDDQDIFYLTQKELQEKRWAQTLVASMKKMDGKCFTAQLRSSINPDLDGCSGQYRVVITDVTKQKRLEKAIIESKKAWEMTFDAMKDIVLLMDKDLRVTRANKAAHSFFNVELGGLIGKHCYDLYMGNLIPCPCCNILDKINSFPYHFSKTEENKELDKFFMISFDPVFNDSGDLEHLVSVSKDITKEKKLEEKLLQAQKMEAMGTLAGGIAHDFNNILSAIYGYTELILDDIQEPNPIKVYAEQVLEASNRAVNLVNQILTFSRKNHKNKNKPLPPQIIVKEVVKMLRTSLPASMEITYNIDPYCDTVPVDPASLHQVLMNLCTNALQASKNDRGLITIQLSNRTLEPQEVEGELDVNPGAYVELMVTDNSGGMDKTMINRLFEPYYTTRKMGSGIGLAVVYGIIKSYKGMIKVESEVGKGSTFRIYFPSAGKAAQKWAPNNP